jgi:hypothetical protein
VLWKENAPATSGPITAQLDLTTVSSATYTNVALEFAMYDFAGAVTSSALDVGIGTHDSSGSSTTINPGNLPGVTAGDLIFVFFQSEGSTSIPVGSGYTAGVTAVVATGGQVQYNLSSSGGTVATAFGGAEPYWAATGVAFKAAASPPPGSGVARHKGYVF